MATGRTVGKFSNVWLEDSGGTMRNIPVSTVGGVGITYDEVDVSALQDAFKSALPGHGNVSVTISGPLDNTAATAAAASGAAPALSGSHTVLAALNGGQTPRAFGIGFGIRGYYTNGDPLFGANGATSTAGVTVTDYQADPAGMTYSARLTLYPGTSPSWLNTLATT